MENISVYSLRMVKERQVEYDLEERKMASPDVVANILDEIYSLGSQPEEMFIMLGLNTKNCIVDISVVSHGTINASIVHPRDVFKRAILANSNAIILAHNHPSGDTTPSSEDLQITSRLVDAGELMGVKVLDHIIVGGNKYMSFKEKNLI